MLKVSTYLAESEHGLSVFPLYGPSDSSFEKTAAPGLMPNVLRYIDTLRPRNDAQYVLVNALGAGEYYSSNINADHFPEAALIHKPARWTGNPLLDKNAAKDWPYGFPTFYGAHPFAHHRNKDASRAYGEVEFADWNDHMKRVELVTRVDLDKCQRFGGVGVWDRLREGQHADVSMGSRVPFDFCSCCGDQATYSKALATFIPGKHKHPGIAVLEYHKKLKGKNGKGIRGLSITRADYCECMLRRPNKILPDGRKVFVYNDFPRFFDISFVFIGADRTAKVMVYIIRAGSHEKFAMPSAEAADNMGLVDTESKVASVSDDLLKAAFLGKDAEIEKEVVPSQFAAKAVPVLTRHEPDLSSDMLDALSAVELPRALTTLTAMGIVLRPREYQRVAITGAGGKALADKYASAGVLFEASTEEEPAGMSAELFNAPLSRMLKSAMLMRSALGPIIEKRAAVLLGAPEIKQVTATSLSTPLLRKIGAAYNGYRRGVMDIVTNAQDMLQGAVGSHEDLRKLSAASVSDLFTPLAYQYLDGAFKDEVPQLAGASVKTSSKRCRRGEGTPLVEHAEWQQSSQEFPNE